LLRLRKKRARSC